MEGVGVTRAAKRERSFLSESGSFRLLDRSGSYGRDHLKSIQSVYLKAIATSGMPTKTKHPLKKVQLN